MKESERYYQPHTSKEALRKVQALFNSYCRAPLTTELLQYHHQLTQQVVTDILPAARREQQPARVAAANRIYQIMLRWSAVRLAGQPWIGKLVDFQLTEPQNSPKRQVRTTKIHSHQPGRSVRH